MRRLALLVAVLTLALPAAPVRSEEARVSYRPPVEAPVVDEFRPPPEQWNAGNRGIDYAPPPGTAVGASGDGEVAFAGQVGGQLHVVVLHADGIRTSYSFLASLAVHRGDRVRQGQTVGTSGDGLHFGARVGDSYIDPRTLFDSGPPRVHLVPDDVRRPGTEAEERTGLRRFLDGMRRVAGTVADTVRDVGRIVVDEAKRGVQEQIDEYRGRIEELLGVFHSATQFHWATHAFRLGRTAVDWYRQRSDCTPATVAPPPLPERRVAVLVGGLGSSSDTRDPVEDVDPKALGYADSVRLSYNGGTTQDQAYDARDTTVDIRTSARRLRELLERIAREHPGQTVDLIGYGQGGIVARAALAFEAKDQEQKLPKVANLITLASPHHGSDIATALAMTGHTEIGDLAQEAVDVVGLAPFDPRGESVRQTSETSLFLWQLNHTALPDGVRFRSIGSRGDLIVPGNHTRVAGADNAIVSVPGALTDHQKLPGSAAARREVALAAAGLPPTCQSLTDMLVDTAVSEAISTAEDAAGAALYAGARRIDRGVNDARSDRPPPDRGRRAGGDDGRVQQQRQPQRK